MRQNATDCLFSIYCNFLVLQGSLGKILCCSRAFYKCVDFHSVIILLDIVLRMHYASVIVTNIVELRTEKAE